MELMKIFTTSKTSTPYPRPRGTFALDSDVTRMFDPFRVRLRMQLLFCHSGQAARDPACRATHQGGAL